MDAGEARDQSLARLASAFCIASRWLTAPALGIAGVALSLITLGNANSATRSAMAMIVIAGGLQAYLAFRIELDRVVFDAFSVQAGALSDTRAFDEAMLSLVLMRAERAGRGMPERVRGLVFLVKSAGLVLFVQIAVAIIAICSLA